VAEKTRIRRDTIAYIPKGVVHKIRIEMVQLTYIPSISLGCLGGLVLSHWCHLAAFSMAEDCCNCLLSTLLI